MSQFLPNRQNIVKDHFAYLALASAKPLLSLANMDKEKESNGLRLARKRADLTLEELAERTGLSPGYLSRMESANRNISTKNLRKIAAALGTTADRLLSATAAPDQTLMPVKGEVRAGAWLEIDGENDRFETIPALPDPRYARVPQYALKVVGTSMNKIAPPGQLSLIHI